MQIFFSDSSVGSTQYPDSCIPLPSFPHQRTATHLFCFWHVTILYLPVVAWYQRNNYFLITFPSGVLHLCLGIKGSLVSGGERVCVSFVRTALLLGQGTVCWILMPQCQSQPVWKGQRGRCWLPSAEPQPGGSLAVGSSASCWDPCADGERRSSAWNTSSSRNLPGCSAQQPGSSGTFPLNIYNWLPQNIVLSKAGGCIRAAGVCWRWFFMCVWCVL